MLNKVGIVGYKHFPYLGKVGTKHYFFGRYIDCVPYDKDDEIIAAKDSSFHNVHSIIIFESTSDSIHLKPVISRSVFDVVLDISDPELISSPTGTFLHIYIVSGNGGWDEGELYILGSNGWRYKHSLKWQAFIS